MCEIMSSSNFSNDVDWSFLSKVYSMLRDEGFLNTEGSDKLVRFKYPNELQDVFDFSIDTETPLDHAQIEVICRQIMQFSVKTGHPHFHNQLFAGVDPFGLAGSWITDALNTSQYTFEVGPIFTIIESVILSKVRSMIGFEDGDGIFAPGGSISNMYAMTAARYKMFPETKTKGLWGLPPIVAFTSEDSHYSIKKSVHWLGIGTDNLVSVKTDKNGGIIPEELEHEIRRTLEEGKVPFFVNATAGTTVLGAFDDFIAVSKICSKYKIWMHVDACLGGSAMFSNTHKHLLNGIENADSVAWNPHKTLGAPLQCSILVLKEKNLLHRCNSANAQYLFQQDKFYDVSYDTGDKSVQCGRKVDALKIWLMLKSRGISEFGRLFDNAMECSKYLTQQIKSRPGFRLVLNEFQYTNVCFWYIPKRLRDKAETDEWWKEIFEIPCRMKKMMIENGRIMVGYTPLSHKGLGNFFRMVNTCFTPPDEKSMDAIIIEIESLGEQL